jgi:hypothetical protein
MSVSHGARRLPGLEVVSYNVELKDEDGYVGDRASKGAFRRFVDEWRKPLRRIGQDPFGNEQSAKIAKKKLDDLLAKGDAESAGIVQRGRPNPSRKSLLACGAAFSSLKIGKTPNASSSAADLPAAASANSPSAAPWCC